MLHQRIRDAGAAGIASDIHAPEQAFMLQFPANDPTNTCYSQKLLTASRASDVISCQALLNIFLRLLFFVFQSRPELSRLGSKHVHTDFMKRFPVFRTKASNKVIPHLFVRSVFVTYHPSSQSRFERIAAVGESLVRASSSAHYLK